jgi:4'-phosphopantetheinyl transferase
MSPAGPDQASIMLSPGPLLLADHQADVWLADTDAPDPTDDLLANYQRLLDPEERQRQSRFRFERDRRGFLIGHVLVRAALSAYTGVHPADWRFERNQFGRPEPIINGSRPLRFNLSGTAGLVACVITRQADVGIDVEDVTRIDDPMSVARHCFAPAEVAELAALTGAAQRVRFFELWTLKEACFKAMGVGLSAGLDQVPDHREWQFHLSRPGAAMRHMLTAAIRRRGSEAKFQFVERWGVPLASD